MRRKRSHEESWIAYADQLLCMVGVFVLIAMILFMISHTPVPPKQEGIKPKAEYLVVLTWDDHRDVDLDLWMQHDDCTIYYQNRECVNMNLDRDSLGYRSNLKILENGAEALSPNQEIISIRAVMPGDYVAAVSYFAGQDATSQVPYNFSGPDPGAAIDCTVQLIKVNPAVTTEGNTTLHLTMVKQTMNALAFHVNADGSVVMQPLPAEDMISSHQRIN